jgi:anti-sigma-K factor RskA
VAERLARKLTCAEAAEFAPAFVLGALDADEMQAVRDHLAECVNDHSEFQEFGSVLPALLESVPVVEPRPELGERIMAAARNDRAARVQSAWSPPKLVTPTTQPLPATAQRRMPSTWIALAAAVALIAAALGVWNLQLKGQVDELAAYRTAVAGVIDRAAEGGQIAILTNLVITLGGQLNGPPPPAGIAGIGSDGSVAIAMTNLGPTTGIEVYEVWVIGGDGKPVPVGDFRVAASGAGGTVIAIGSSEAGVTIALTREPKPGATVPTLPILALGTAEKPGT